MDLKLKLKFVFYQLAPHEAHSRLVLKITLCFPCLYLCTVYCASALIMCAIITSRRLLPSNLTLIVDFGNLDGCFV